MPHADCVRLVKSLLGRGEENGSGEVSAKGSCNFGQLADPKNGRLGGPPPNEGQGGNKGAVERQRNSRERRCRAKQRGGRSQNAADRGR
eukprot:7555577-Alexandrium_andersonii.AAC.1